MILVFVVEVGLVGVLMVVLGRVVFLGESRCMEKMFSF